MNFIHTVIKTQNTCLDKVQCSNGIVLRAINGVYGSSVLNNMLLKVWVHSFRAELTTRFENIKSYHGSV